MLQWILDNLGLVASLITVIFVFYFLMSSSRYSYRKSAPMPSAPPVRPERVEFAAFTPRAIAPNCHFILDIWAFLKSDYQIVHSLAKQLDREIKVGLKAGVLISRGAVLTIAIEVPSLRIADPVDTMVWEGEPTNASYHIEVPRTLIKCLDSGL